MLGAREKKLALKERRRKRWHGIAVSVLQLLVSNCKAISKEKDLLPTCVFKTRVKGLDFISQKEIHHLAAELQISFFLKNGGHRAARVSNPPRSTPESPIALCGPWRPEFLSISNLAWGQMPNTLTELAWQMCAGRALASSWHHTKRNPDREPSDIW